MAPAQDRCAAAGSAAVAGAGQAPTQAVIEMVMETVTGTMRAVRCDMLGSCKRPAVADR